jgi:hypothetical protein
VAWLLPAGSATVRTRVPTTQRVFDAASIWPVVLAVGAMLLGTGAIFGSGVLLVGVIVTVLAVVGLVAQTGR